MAAPGSSRSTSTVWSAPNALASSSLAGEGPATVSRAALPWMSNCESSSPVGPAPKTRTSDPGASASVFGSLIRAYADKLAIAAGVIIIIMGLHFLGVTRIALMYREKRAEVPKPVGLWGAYLMGLAFAFGWTPCIGPILAVILAIAASEATVTKGAGLLAIYSLGLGIPFLVAAFAVEPFAKFLARFRAYLPMVEKTMGGLLVLTGIAFLTGFVTSASFWILETFPALGKIG